MNSLPLAIYCPDLEHPQYGSVKIIGKNVDGKAEYKCNNGYKLYGSSQRKCLYSGVWDGSLPTCKRKFPLLRSSAICRPSHVWPIATNVLIGDVQTSKLTVAYHCPLHVGARFACIGCLGCHSVSAWQDDSPYTLFLLL